MFSGLVTAVGRVRSVVPAQEGLTLTIEAPYQDLEDGESIAINGACLTVERHESGSFAVHCVPTTLERTSFRDYQVGERVNLERALRIGDRLGGHMVQGHVDGVGVIVGMVVHEDTTILEIRVPESVARVTVPMGSITIDGVSLTVIDTMGDRVRVSLIPFTLQNTTLRHAITGNRVHVEGDVLGKYVEGLLARTKA